MIIEDFGSKPPDPVAFGFTVFMDPAVAATAEPLARAGQASEFINRTVAGEGVLNEAQIAQANSGGGVATVAFGGRADLHLSPLEADELGRVMGQTYAQAHQGYQIQLILMLCAYGGHAEVMTTAGLCRYGERTDMPPYILGLSKTQGRQNRGSFFDVMLTYEKPRLYLSPSQRELAALALEGKSDEEISREIRLTIDGVKKRWRALFAAAEDAMPDLLPPLPLDGKRGVEKRDRLLEYLRHRPEALRPHAPR